MERDFVHLHVHSEFSLLSSTCRIKDLVATLAERGDKAIALTDLGNLFGTIEFVLACQTKHIKPIIGCDIFVAPKSRLERKTYGLPGASYTLVLLCKNNVGYTNLVKLVSAGYLEGFYYRPRIDKEILRAHSEGLIALSGALSSEIPHLINVGQVEQAKQVALEYKNIFGPNNFYLEIQDSKLRDQDKVNAALIQFSKELDIPLVATSNVFYMTQKDAEALEALQCIQNQNTLQDDDRVKVYTDQNYLKTRDDMWQSFESIPEALSNSCKIAEACNVTIDFNTVNLPHFETPNGMTVPEYFRMIVYEGARKRYSKVEGDLQERIEFELDVIQKLGYDSYFLIVWDFVKFARDNGVPVGPGRGSAAGSVISYCLEITNLDPLKYDLLFERFLNPARVSMPDIDIDFCYEGRDRVIQYVSNKYTKDRVAQIITFGTMLAKGVIRDVGRVLGMAYADVDRIAKLIPNDLGIKLKDALEQEPQLKEMIKSDPQVRQLFELSAALEGLPRHASTHAAGVVISAKPLTDSIPLFKTPDGQISTQFPMSSLESIKMLKMDFLGLKTLTVIHDTVKIIKRTKKIDIYIDALPIDDRPTYEMLSKAKSMGIFQLESSGMRDILSKLKPDKFEDLIAILALYRPGPIGSGMVDDFIKRKNGETKVAYDHPLLEPILKDTYGVMVYQEQIMKIVSALAGFDLAQADLLRRAIGKKKAEVITQQKMNFVQGCIKNSIREELASKIFELIMYFAGYGFNKSHSAAYALVSYQTAYLKCHYPVEFMTALLSSEMGNTDKIVQYIEECKRMGISVLPPDVNTSFPRFTMVNEREIRFGLAAVKNVGQTAIDTIIQTRMKINSFKSLQDFVQSVDTRVCNRKTMESLIKCGAMDLIYKNRSYLMDSLDRELSHASSLQKDRQRGQLSMFDGMNAQPVFSNHTNGQAEAADWPEPQKLAYEKELLGFYVTGHPLDRFKKEFERYSAAHTGNLKEQPTDVEVNIGALISKIKLTVTKKKQEKMAILTLEDLYGTVDALVFPRVYATCDHLLKEDEILFFKGRVDQAEDTPKLIVSEVHGVSEIRNLKTRGVIIDMHSAETSDKILQELQQLFTQHSGQTPVYIHFYQPSGSKTEIIIDRSLYVSPSPDFVDFLERLLGNVGTVHLLT